MPARTATRRGALMAALFALLVVNTVIYLASGTASEALDSLAWLALLALFELETARGVDAGRPRLRRAIRALRLLAAAALVAALAGYLLEREWLDVANMTLWVAVVALLELEVRRPDAVARHRAPFSAAAIALYGGLAAVAAAWLWQGLWFDAYDALLWLAAFAVLEVDVLALTAAPKPSA